ncbi:MAG TPA: hypothetical protein VGM29_17210 [Polyangiaceae bacterium]|jgi:hypothetical protein
MIRLSERLALLGLALLPLACTVGEGEGWVRSDHLAMEGCWSGAFDLGPDFFGANPDQGQSLAIRVQRGDNSEDASDGLSVLVNNLPVARSQVGQALKVGLPVGVSPSGVPLMAQADPAKVNLSLYLHNTCHLQNSTVYSIDGTITFTSLFSGDPNESSSKDRLTEASFEADFADPRELVGVTDPDAIAAATSKVSGYFRFFFQRGQPAQPFVE